MHRSSAIGEKNLRPLSMLPLGPVIASVILSYLVLGTGVHVPQHCVSANAVDGGQVQMWGLVLYSCRLNLWREELQTSIGSALHFRAAAHMCTFQPGRPHRFAHSICNKNLSIRLVCCITYSREE